MVEPRKILLSRPSDLIAAMPYLVGFTPINSLVCVVLDNQKITITARLDLPEPTEVYEFTVPAAQSATMLSEYGSTVLLVGYGPVECVAPAAAVIATALRAADVDVQQVMAVDNGYYWCLCGDTDCADGVPYNHADSIVPAEAVYLGIAPLPDRAALEHLITPVTGVEHDRMHATTETALRRLTSMLASSNVPPSRGARPSPPSHVVREGIATVQQAYETATRNESLSDDEVAWLSAVLLVPEIRDHAWIASDGSEEQRRLWIDVTRRAMPATSAAPAFLLAVTAYLAGDGALANIAVDRALRVDPDYRAAHLLGYALQAGMPPHLWRQATTGTTE